jgi:hypothetical protein
MPALPALIALNGELFMPSELYGPSVFLPQLFEDHRVLMGWSGRAPAPPAIEAGVGRPTSRAHKPIAMQ